MTPVEALQLAFERESAASEAYAKMAREHPEIRDLLLLLHDEEEKHKVLIQKKRVELTRF